MALAPLPPMWELNPTTTPCCLFGGGKEKTTFTSGLSCHYQTINISLPDFLRFIYFVALDRLELPPKDPKSFVLTITPKGKMRGFPSLPSVDFLLTCCIGY